MSAQHQVLFMVANSATPFDLSFVTSAVSTSNASSYSFSSTSTGVADASRYTIVAYGFAFTGSLSGVTTTLDGNAMSQVVSQVATNTISRIYAISNPTGTTATFASSITGASPQNMGIAVFRLVGAPSGTASATMSDNTVSSNALANALTIPSGGAGIGYVFAYDTGTTVRTWTWTNLSEQMDQTVESASSMRASHSAALSTSAGGTTRTATASGAIAGGGVLVAAAWDD